MIGRLPARAPECGVGKPVLPVIGFSAPPTVFGSFAGNPPAIRKPIAAHQDLGSRNRAAQGKVDAIRRQRLGCERCVADCDPVVADGRVELMAGAGRDADPAARRAASEVADMLGPRDGIGPAAHSRQS